MHLLLNWLWQGCVIAIAAAGAIRAARLSQATVRCYVWWAALLLVLMLPVIPAVSPLTDARLATDRSERFVPVVVVPDSLAATSSIAVILWCVWIAVHMARLVVDVLALRRTHARSLLIPSPVEARLRYWALIRGQGRPTRLVISDGVRAAAVLGVVAPRIVLAPALLEQLNLDELDRVVVHEWAHVQRRDDLANLVQLLVRVAAGWHPAVWWIDRQLRFEREVACDDTAVRITGAPKAYAAGLVKLASLLSARVPALPVPGVLSSSRIGKRIVRILAPKRKTSAGWTLTAAATATASLSVIAWCVAGFELVQVGPAAFAPVADTGRVPVMVVRSESGRAPAVTGALRMSRRAASAPSRGVADQKRQEVPAGPAPDPPTVDSPVVPIGAAHSPAVDQPPLPATVLSQSAAVLPPVDGVKPPSPWNTAADAGVAVGRSSKNAAVATAGAFTRFGKKIAGSF